MTANKIIVTNLGALQAKYGANFGRIQTAVNKLIQADASRGLTSIMIGMDDQNSMKVVGAVPVANGLDPKENKTAIDAIYNHYAPDYILILGAVDIVPHQDLANPVYTAGNLDGDPDPIVSSDLPYACSAPYGTAISNFKNPTRVVGRLPDVTGSNDPAYLEKLLNSAAGYAPNPASVYRDFLGVTAGVWSGSTSLSLQAAFGTAKGMNNVPPVTYRFPATSLAALSHFYNCHGAPSMPQYFGQPADGSQQYPVACDAAYVAGRIKRGTVAAAECCYGAELYSPSRLGQHQGIPNQYLEDGAFGFFGSTTVAYGPEHANDWADLLCQYFFVSLLSGASLGRATLEARQHYILNKAHLTGTDLKTLAQFILLGDPSVTPVDSAKPSPSAHFMAKAGTFVVADPREDAAFKRKTRRQALLQNGLALGASVSSSEFKNNEPMRPEMVNLLREETSKLHITSPTLASYEVESPPAVALAKTLSFRLGQAPELESVSNAVPTRKLKAVHYAVGRSGPRSDQAIRLVGVEVLEFDDSVTVHPFVSK